MMLNLKGNKKQSNLITYTHSLAKEQGGITEWAFRREAKNKANSDRVRFSIKGGTVSIKQFRSISFELRTLANLPGNSGKGNNPLTLQLVDNNGVRRRFRFLGGLPVGNWLRFTIPLDSPFWKGSKKVLKNVNNVDFMVQTLRLDLGKEYVFQVRNIELDKNIVTYSVQNLNFQPVTTSDTAYRVGTDNNLEVWYVDDDIKVFASTKFTHSMRDHARLDGAQGETVSFQLRFVTPYEFGTVRVAPADLKSSLGTITADRISVNKIGFVDIGSSSPTGQVFAEYVYINKNTVSLSKSDSPHAMAWVEVSIPPGTEPGEYGGDLDVVFNFEQKKTTVKVPIVLYVHNINISTSTPPPIVGNLRTKNFNYYTKRPFKELASQYYQVLQDHHINGITGDIGAQLPYSSAQSSRQEIELYFDNVKGLQNIYGFRLFYVPNVFISKKSLRRSFLNFTWSGGKWNGRSIFDGEGRITQKFLKSYSLHLSLFEEYANMTSLKGQFIARVVDELRESQLSNYRQIYKVIRENAPNIRTAITGRYSDTVAETFVGLIDDWIIHILYVPSIEKVKRIELSGSKVGMYDNHAYLMYHDTFLPMRRIPWTMERYHMNGIYYFWSVTNWAGIDIRYNHKDTNELLHENVSANANFIYPEKGTGDVEAVSIRLKAFRNGLQDRMIVQVIQQTLDGLSVKGSIDKINSEQISKMIDEITQQLVEDKYSKPPSPSVSTQLKRDLLELADQLKIY